MFRVKTIWSGVGTTGYTTHHFSGSDPADAQECSSKVETFWTDTRNTRISSVIATMAGEVEIVNEDTGEVTDIVSVTPTAVTGGAAAQERVPDIVHILVRLRTESVVAGRRARGRFFVPGTAAQYVSAGNLISTAQTIYGNAIPFLIAPVAFEGPQLGVWSRPRQLDENTTRLGTLSPVTAGSVWTEFASLRSRRD